MGYDSELEKTIRDREKLTIKCTLLYCLQNNEKLDDLSPDGLDEVTNIIFERIQIMKRKSTNLDGETDGK